MTEQETAGRRPKLHFTPRYGWMNDPNGLVRAGGFWHLYFQHNPEGLAWEHIGWGHAVSENLTDWQQRGDVLYPNGDGMAFSGSAVENRRCLLGLPATALLYFYTAAGHTTPESAGLDFVQKTAYSVDGGDTLHILNELTLPALERENRDPKVFWHEPSAAYVMCLWLKNDEFGIFRSVDLRRWELSQRLTLPGGFECPDLFPLTVEDETVWVFWTASGTWYAGAFDGYRFCWSGEMHNAYCNRLPYAAQTFANVPGRAISMHWLRCANEGRPYTGAMSLPRELGLTRRGDRLAIRQPLTPEVLRRFRPYAEGAEATLPADGVLLMETAAEGDVRWDIGGFPLRYSQSEGALYAGDERLEIGRVADGFTVLADGHLLEITADSAIIYAAIDIPAGPASSAVRIEAENGGPSRFSAVGNR
jgi:fructan beta-fructosidase